MKTAIEQQKEILAADMLLQLQKCAREIIENPVLDQIASGEMAHKNWLDFARQRYYAAHHFEELLEACIRKAREELQDEDIALALQDNLNDERGINREGRALAVGPHSKWRQDYYSALGLSEDDLASIVPTEGSVRYDAVIRQFIEKSDALTAIGAMLLQEYSIPDEFERILQGMEHSFPDRFVIQSSDSTDVKKQKIAARMYIVHHIGHDKEQHFPDLENPLRKYYLDDISRNKILTGMEMLKEARKDFYRSLE